jgi:hypothetical protein
MFETGKPAAEIIKAKGFEQVSDTGALEAIVEQILAANPEKVAEVKGGNEKAMNWFTGQAMKASQGKANPKMVTEIVRKKVLKGGQQDRTLASDLPLSAKSGSMPVASFCVEQGRWTKRGNESADSFATSKNSIATKEGKLAVRKSENQSEVWKSVAKAQESLSRNIGKDVKPVASASSLQLTLEDKDLKAKLKAFQVTLLPLVEAHPRSLGFVYAINGEINSAEIFAGHDLFRRVWPKLVDGMATEAVALADGAKSETPPSADAARNFIAKAEAVAAFEKPLSGSLQHVSAESDDSCLFETVDSKKGGQWLRRHIIKK